MQQFSRYLQVPELQIPQRPNAIAKDLKDCVPARIKMMAVKAGASSLRALRRKLKITSALPSGKEASPLLLPLLRTLRFF